MTLTLSERHAKQLLARGLEPEIAVRHGWISGGPLTDGICIPYVMNGETVNRKFRTLAGEKKFAQDKGGVKCFWNFDALKNESGPIVITEGECDALAAIQAGYLRTVSVPDGAPSQPMGDADGPKYAYLDSALSILRGADEIILATDADGPGGYLFHDLLLRLGRARCKFVTYPLKKDGTRCKDLNQALQEYGPQGVEQTLARAQWTKLGGVYRMSELPPLPEHFVMELGFENSIGRLAKARRGDFWVVSGPPGGGKTSFMLDAVCRTVMAHNLRVAWASFENLPQQDLKRQLRKWRIATMRLGVLGYQPGDMGAKWTQLEVQDADEWIEAHFRFLVPDPDEDVTFAWFIERANAAVIREECDVVLLDPWNELDHAPGDMPLTVYVGEAIKKMKQTARKLQVWWIVIAHPAKMRTGDQLSLYSISDSAHWFNKADIGLLINREGDGADAKIICAKARYEEIGTRGEAKALFNPETRRFGVPAEIGVEP
jgi:twinkle protein